MKLLNADHINEIRGWAVLECLYCNQTFQRRASSIRRGIKTGRATGEYCSNKCSHAARITKQEVQCKHCTKKFYKHLNEINKKPNHFCSRSCLAIYKNTHKTKGIRVSKLELWLQGQLPVLYPKLEFHFNRKDTIQSELDIYIPSLKLGFELNGPYHYEPIYGPERLKQTQNNDKRKFQACLEKGVELVIIDASKMSYFKEYKGIKFLKIIQNILDLKLNDYN